MSIMDLLRDALSVDGVPGQVIDWAVMFVVVAAGLTSLPIFANVAVAHTQELYARLRGKPSAQKRARRT